MKAITRGLSAALTLATCLIAQEGRVITGSGYSLPPPLRVAPGQILTLFVTGDGSTIGASGNVPAGQDLPLELAGFSVGWTILAHSVRAPVSSVSQILNCDSSVADALYCKRGLALTVQVPFEVCDQTQCRGLNYPYVFQNGIAYSWIDAIPKMDQVHILRSYETLAPAGPSWDFPCWGGASYQGTQGINGLPCPPIVTHADGSLVRPSSPARPGEELVAYAVGLGQTSPASVTGQVVKTPSPTSTKFALDFNYRPNALATKPRPLGPGSPSVEPMYAGSTAGYVGLYQINFTVPPVPQGTPPCRIYKNSVDFDPDGIFSNLTVSVGGKESFDGVGICVAVDQSKQEML